MTNLNRRQFAVIAGLGTLGLASCAAPEAPSLTVSARSLPGMNPGPDGSDRPVTLTVVQMTGTGAFDGADAVTLSNPEAALGAELVDARQIVLAPGDSATTTVPVLPGVTAIGIVAGLRDNDGKVFRRKVPVPAGPADVAVTVGPGGLSIG